MSTKQLEKMVARLSQEVALLRTTVKDIVKIQKKVLRLKPEFVEKVHKLAKRKSVGKKFTSAKKFLETIS